MHLPAGTVGAGSNTVPAVAAAAVQVWVLALKWVSPRSCPCSSLWPRWPF